MASGTGSWAQEESKCHQGLQFSPVSPASILRMMMEQIFMEAFSKHLQNKKVVDKYPVWGVQKMKADSPQCCPGTGQEAMGTLKYLPLHLN